MTIIMNAHFKESLMLVLQKLYIQMQNNETELLCYTTHKNLLKWIKT